MDNLMHELERTCERTTKELHDLNDRLEQNKNSMSPADLDILFKLMDVVKDIKSTIKKIYEIEDMEGANDMNYSGAYMSQPMWDRRMGYSGNSYNGTYTVNTGDGRYSGTRGMSRGYSRNSERDNMRMQLDDMLNNARDEREAETIRKIMNKL